MNHAPKTPLERRLALRLGVALAMFVVVLGVVVFGMGYAQQLDAARQRQNQLVQTVHTSATVAAFAHNPEIAQDVVAGLIGNTYVLAARIQTPDGFTFELSNQPLVRWTAESAVDYPLYSPISQSEQIATLRVLPDVPKIRHDALIFAMGYATLPVFELLLAAFMILWLVRTFIGRPIAEMAKALSQIQPGKTGGQRIAMPHNHDHDEIGLLAHSANRLIEATEQALAQERNLRRKVQAMEARYRHIFQTTSIGIMVLTPKGKLINHNPVLLDSILPEPLTPEQAMQCGDFVREVFANPKDAWSMVRASVDSGAAQTADLQLKSLDGGQRWVHAIVSTTVLESGEVESIEAVLYDVTRRRLTEDAVRQAAERDPLTGLYNRRGIETFLDQALLPAQGGDSHVLVMMMDLDGFKFINDTYGHAAGDEVLQTLSRRLDERVRRASDAVARLGGDEFVVVMGDGGADMAKLNALAQGLVDMVAQPMTLSSGTSVQVGCSLGLAMCPTHGTQRVELLQAADQAMYHVKRHGKKGFAWAA